MHITKCILPGASILSGKLCGVRQTGSAQTGNSGDDLFFGINLTGRGVASQRTRHIRFGDGEAVLLSCSTSAFAIDRPTSTEFIGVRVPRKAIALLAPRLDGREPLFIPAATPALQLLTMYLRNIVVNSANPIELSHLIATHLQDLVAMCIGVNRDSAPVVSRSVRAARLHAIKADIFDNIDNAALTVRVVAARHGVTPRYLHKLFESDGATYTQFVLEQRLNRACRMLRDTRFYERSITSIAFDCGFSDLSYFNRTFRRRFGATPSDVRRS